MGTINTSVDVPLNTLCCMIAQLSVFHSLLHVDHGNGDEKLAKNQRNIHARMTA